MFKRALAFIREKGSQKGYYVNKDFKRAFDGDFEWGSQFDNRGMRVFAIVNKEGNYGSISNEGKWIHQPIYEERIDFEFPYSVALARKGGKYGLIDVNGNTVVRCDYDVIYCNLENDFCAYLLGEKWGIINLKDDKVVIEKPVRTSYETVEVNGKSYDYLYYVLKNGGEGEETSSIGAPSLGVDDRYDNALSDIQFPQLLQIPSGQLYKEVEY